MIKERYAYFLIDILIIFLGVFNYVFPGIINEKINIIFYIELIAFSIFGFIFFFLIASIIKSITLPPSNAGKGSIFINPKFILKYAVRYRIDSTLVCLASPTTEYIPIGPDNALSDILPVIKLIIIAHIV